MGLMFFADHCVPGSAIHLLRNAGYGVMKLRDYIPQDSPDLVVITKARDLEALLISLNGDFVDIVTYPPSRWNGIIALQVRNRPRVIPDIINRLLIYLSTHPAMDHYRGKLFLVEPHRIRIRQ
jgi:predicted nuclease of predicted toxin-antitoxin system